MPGTRVGRAAAFGMFLCLLWGCGPEPIDEAERERRKKAHEEYHKWAAEQEAKEKVRRAAAAKKEEAEERRQREEAERPARFGPHWAKYHALYRQLTRNGKRTASVGGPGKVPGKAIVLDASTGQERMRYLLPAGVEARKPEEVGTVVCVAESKVKVGSYTSMGGYSGDAKVITWTVTLIDPKQREVIAIESFRGAPPPRSISGPIGSVGGASGAAPTAKVESYLKSFAWRTR